MLIPLIFTLNLLLRKFWSCIEFYTYIVDKLQKLNGFGDSTPFS